MTDSPRSETEPSAPHHLPESAAPADTSGLGESSGPDGAGPTFEQSLRHLEIAVARLEKDDLTLDDALALYERGVELSRRCHELLGDAELRLRQIDAAGEDAGPVDL